MRLRKHGVRNNWNDGWRDERNLEGRGLRIESEKERNGAQLCRGTSGSVVALSKAHKFPNRWKMHFSNRAPGRFAQVDSFTDPKNTFLFTVSFAHENKPRLFDSAFLNTWFDIELYSIFDGSRK